jgi:hypothetical protein
MNSSAESLTGGNGLLPQGASILSRKVARSGHISYEGRSYFISKTLAGRYIRLVVLADRPIVDAAIPLHQEYRSARREDSGFCSAGSHEASIYRPSG